MTDTPTAISCSELDILGVRLRCYVLDNGMRVIDSEDMANLLNALSYGPALTQHDSVRLARFIKAIPEPKSEKQNQDSA